MQVSNQMDWYRNKNRERENSFASGDDSSIEHFFSTPAEIPSGPVALYSTNAARVLRNKDSRKWTSLKSWYSGDRVRVAHSG